MGGSPELRSSRPARPTWGNTISTKNAKKISWVWWQAPVIPATWEAEAGELLEPERQRLQPAEIMPLHSSLGSRVKLCLRKRKSQKITYAGKVVEKKEHLYIVGGSVNEFNHCGRQCGDFSKT